METQPETPTLLSPKKSEYPDLPACQGLVTKTDLFTLKSFKNPPVSVKVILEAFAVLYLKQRNPLWKDIQRIFRLEQNKIMQFILVPSLTQEYIRLAKSKLRTVSVHETERVCKAACGLLEWMLSLEIAASGDKEICSYKRPQTASKAVKTPELSVKLAAT